MSKVNESKIIKCYRFVTNDLKSKKGNIQWKIGKWVKQDGKLELCENGLHASKEPSDSLSYVFGDRWFLAETRGEILEGDDKLCASEMRIIKEIPASVIQRYAVDCAEHVLHIYEKEHPNDSRIRNCIEAVKAFLDNPTDDNRQKMKSAAGSAAWSAERKWQNKHLKQLIKEALK